MSYSIRDKSHQKWTNRLLRDSFRIKVIYVVILFIVAVSTTFASILYAINLSSNNNFLTYSSKSDIATMPESTIESSVKDNANEQDAMLAFLIEEEKLAHDVYTTFYNIYGAKVFGNILKSESTHQSAVLELLKARDLSDPRSSEVGVFNNSDLQKLYNQLIEQGKTSAEEAYKVGVAIEDKDIADITKQLATATDADIVSTLEKLRSGSENHLRAFNRQIGKY